MRFVFFPTIVAVTASALVAYANTMDRSETIAAIARSISAPNFAIETEKLGLPRGSVVVWTGTPTYKLFDFTDGEITRKEGYSLSSPLDYISDHTKLEFKQDNIGRMKVIVDDDIFSLSQFEKMKRLVDAVAMPATDAAQLARQISPGQGCFYKRTLSPNGILAGGVIIASPKYLSNAAPKVMSELDCIYLGALYISGFSGDKISQGKLGSSFGNFYCTPPVRAAY